LAYALILSVLWLIGIEVLTLFKGLCKKSNTKRILVEGASDRIILQKSFIIEGLDYGITNGHGSNIVSIASKLNDEDISVLVLTDDDKDGKKYKENILKMKGVYTPSNVYTIKDLVPEVIDNATIEDCLGVDYIQSQCTLLYKEIFKKDYHSKLEEDSSFLNQIKIHLQKSNKGKKEIDDFLEKLKINISENFNPIKVTFSEKFPLLNQLTKNITKKINENIKGWYFTHI